MLLFIFITIVVIMIVIIMSFAINNKVDNEIIESSIELPSNLNEELEKAIRKDKVKIKEEENKKIKEEQSLELLQSEDNVKQQDVEKVIYDKSKFQKKNKSVLVSLNHILSAKTF